MTDFDPNWPHGHVTRDGRRARIICRDRKSGLGNPIVALIDNGPAERTCVYTAEGIASPGDGHDCDLLNAPAPKRVWEGCLVEYRDGNITGWSDEKMARGEAYTVAGAVFRGRHRIEFPEG